MVFVHVEGNQCGQLNLLCTPYFNRILQMLNRADLRSEFLSENPPPLERSLPFWTQCTLSLLLLLRRIQDTILHDCPILEAELK
jgi:hypothetical protein